MGQADADRFLEACGSVGPLRLGLADERRPGGSEIEPRDFRQPCLVLGSDSAADLVLDHPEISRKHAYLQLIAGRLFCMDLRSRTGVHWEGGARSLGWVGPGESIRVGPFRIRFEGGPGPWVGPSAAPPDLPPPTSRAFEQPGLVEATLEFVEPEAERSAWRVSRSLILLGRSTACRVRLPIPGVSTFHGSLVRTPAGLWAIDLLGKGGILVNGERVKFSRLDRDDELSMGPCRIILRHGVVSDRPPQLPALPTDRAKTQGPPARLADDATADPLPSLVPEMGQFLANRPELPDALLREFGQMQLQMADQFQQALMMMFRMFSGMHQDQLSKFGEMHQDQMALIREELARIHQLTEEQQALQVALSAGHFEPADRPTLRLFSAEPRPPAPETARAPVAVARTRSPAIIEGVGRPERISGGSRQPRDVPAPNPDEVHATLARRLAAIQEERQGRWQKLLGAMMGKVSQDGLL